MRLTSFFCLILITTAPLSLKAHEYWAEPVGSAYLKVGAALEADFKVGQSFKGSRNAYIPQLIRELSVQRPDGRNEVLEGELGQRPAAQTVGTEAGTHIIALVTEDSDITWRIAEKFENFVKYEGFPEKLAEHQVRGLPPVGFKETFARSVKALFRVEDLEFKDQALGLPLEIVLVEGPKQGRIKLQVLRDGDAVDDIQVRKFQKIGEQVQPETVARTDAQGFTELDVTGGGLVMLNAVTLEPVENPSSDIVWHSWWGNLTFRID